MAIRISDPGPDVKSGLALSCRKPSTDAGAGSTSGEDCPQRGGQGAAGNSLQEAASSLSGGQGAFGEIFPGGSVVIYVVRLPS